MHASLLLGCLLETAFNYLWKETLSRLNSPVTSCSLESVCTEPSQEMNPTFWYSPPKAAVKFSAVTDTHTTPWVTFLCSSYGVTKPQFYRNQHSLFQAIRFTEKGSKKCFIFTEGIPEARRVLGTWDCLCGVCFGPRSLPFGRVRPAAPRDMAGLRLQGRNTLPVMSTRTSNLPEDQLVNDDCQLEVLSSLAYMTRAGPLGPLQESSCGKCSAFLTSGWGQGAKGGKEAGVTDHVWGQTKNDREQARTSRAQATRGNNSFCTWQAPITSSPDWTARERVCITKSYVADQVSAGQE